MGQNGARECIEVLSLPLAADLEPDAVEALYNEELTQAFISSITITPGE